MKIKMIALAGAVLVSGSAVLAQTETTTTTTTTTTSTTVWGLNRWCSQGPLYTANELSLDLFGSYLAGQRKIEDIFKTNIRHGFWGGGVGLNYFPDKYLGIGGDINMPVNGGHLVDNISGQLIARFPIDNSGLAPYVFGGGGRTTWPAWNWEGHAGVGLEYRFNPGMGIFGDARYTWVKNTPDELLIRTGLRVVF